MKYTSGGIYLYILKKSDGALHCIACTIYGPI